MNAKLGLLAAAFLLLAAAGCLPNTKSTRGLHLPPGSAEKGRTAFVELKCTSCHVVDGIELPAPAARRMAVALGGKVDHLRTYGELMTAIVDPARDLSRELPTDLPNLRTGTPMKDANHTMTVAQLIDIVTFLEPRYQPIVVPSEGGMP